MGELINLRRVKKNAERKRAAKVAEVNRAKFGRTKIERTRDEQAAQKARDAVDSHRIGDDNPS